jgi:hypothetical protein
LAASPDFAGCAAAAMSSPKSNPPGLFPDEAAEPALSPASVVIEAFCKASGCKLGRP